jgi:hypothetical protein
MTQYVAAPLHFLVRVTMILLVLVTALRVENRHLHFHSVILLPLLGARRFRDEN